MPLYDYVCKSCGVQQERIFHIDNFPKTVKCAECGKQAIKVIVSGHGGIQTDNDVTWIPDAREQLQQPHEKPFETRTEWKKYLKDRELIAAG